MTTRKVPALKLARSPLVLVLTQVRFSSLLKMREVVPEIQQGLRERGFPRYAQEEMQQFIFGPEVKAERDTKWVFGDRSRTEAVTLSSSSVSYQTSHYDVFETFADRFGAVLDVIAPLTKLEFAERIGLRFVDLVRSSEGRTASDLLRASVRGLSPADLGVPRCRHQFMLQAETEHGDLYVRSFENEGPKFMPPDLFSMHLLYPVDENALGTDPYRIIDIDHIWQSGEVDFNRASIVDKLWCLHEYSSKAFLATVTEEAIKLWSIP
jgi:uncharacterized protein (TIGR04255 family)